MHTNTENNYLHTKTQLMSAECLLKYDTAQQSIIP